MGDVPGQQLLDGTCEINVLIHSSGIWSLSDAKAFLTYALPRLQLQLCLIFIITQCLHALFKHLYLPRLVSEVMAGVILGPTVLGRVSPGTMKTLFPEEGEVFIRGFSVLGFIFFMFLTGVKMDSSKVFKSGIRAWIIGLAGVVIPSLAFMGGMPLNYLPGFRLPVVKLVIGILVKTPFPVIAMLLNDLKITNSELGRLALAATLIADLLNNVVGVLITNVSMSVAGWATSLAIKPHAVTLTCVIFMFSARPVFWYIVRHTPEGKPVKRQYIRLLGFLVIVASFTSKTLGYGYHLFPLLFGLCVPVGPPLGSSLVKKMETVVSGILMPLHMAYSGRNIDLLVVYDMEFTRLLWAVVILSLVIRMSLVLFTAFLSKMPTRDAFTLSLIMSTHGNVQIAFYFSMYTNQIIDKESVSQLILSSMIISSITRILVRLSYDYSITYTGYEKRTILHTSPNAELRILACAYRPDDAVASLNLLAKNILSKDSPVAVYALLLIELVGQVSPLLINHQLGQKSSTGESRLQKIIDIFLQLQKQNQDMVSVNAFTAMSMMKFMHYDICSLAFDKSVSLLILPFHRKWNHLGKLVFDSNALRMVNQQVLEMAPCSVGIFIDRSKIGKHSINTAGNSLYNVAVIFLGGDDDREALAYGKRMSKSTEAIQLTIFHFVAWEDAIVNHWDNVLDIEVLKDLRVMCSNQENIDYREEKLRDGPETALRVNELKEEYDLIIVGRRHREVSPLLTGLTEWNELQELGPIGDVLASKEIKRPVSVLVVQQQLLKKGRKLVYN